MPGDPVAYFNFRRKKLLACLVCNIFDTHHEVTAPYITDDLVPIEAEAGTLVLLHGTLPHWSAPNVSDRSRHAYTLHIIDGVADYPDDNWLRRDATLPMRGFV